MSRLLTVAVIALLYSACSDRPVYRESEIEFDSQGFEMPNQTLGEVFTAVQLSEVFVDSKTFADARRLAPANEIIIDFRKKKNDQDFDIEAFVQKYFDVPQEQSSDFESDRSKTLEEHIKSLWPVLTRSADSDLEGSTLIPLPNPYIVPGGRFREVYYWDSYFTMLGLTSEEELQMMENMIDNFAHLINTVGHIPNGNRTYYLSRSQPPFFAAMVELLAKRRNDDGILKKYLPALQKEYDFWMDGSSDLALDSAYRRTVNVGGTIVNRYFDDYPVARAESYREDMELVNTTGWRPDAEVYTDIKAAAESGWDFSSRWFADSLKMRTIITTDIVPVDLNALIYNLEGVLVKAYQVSGGAEDKIAALNQQMKARSQFINEVCWSESKQAYADYNWKQKKITNRNTLAMMYPLYFEVANEQKAKKTIDYVKTYLMRPGGVLTTDINSSQQWDAPNGWAPLQWLTAVGMDKYGAEESALDLMTKWTTLNEKVYKNTGKMVEKYNVEDLSLEAGGGEYPVQDGFGWSNGVYLAMKSKLKNK